MSGALRSLHLDSEFSFRFDSGEWKTYDIVARMHLAQAQRSPPAIRATDQQGNELSHLFWNTSQ